MQRGHPHLDAFTDLLVQDGLWTQSHHLDPVRRTVVDRDAAGYVAARDVLDRIITGAEPPPDHRVAALAALGTVLDLGTTNRSRLAPAPEALVAASGELSWIVRDVTTFLYDAQADDLAAGRADSATTAAQFGGV